MWIFEHDNECHSSGGLMWDAKISQPIGNYTKAHERIFLALPHTKESAFKKLWRVF